MADDNWRPKLTRIDDPIADDQLKYTTPEGERRISRVIIGRPTAYPRERIWYCPVMIERYLPKITPVFGQGPVDALLNAMNLVRRFVDENFDFVAGAKLSTGTRKRSRPAAGRPARQASTPPRAGKTPTNSRAKRTRRASLRSQ